jgi:hypothetical protein
MTKSAPTTTKHKSNGPGGLGFSRTGKLTHTENATARLAAFPMPDSTVSLPGGGPGSTSAPSPACLTHRT